MEDENERPQECYNFHGIRDFLKKYKSKLQNVHSHRDRYPKTRIDNFKAENDKNKDNNHVNGVKKFEENGGKELCKNSQKHGNCGNHNNYHNNIGCFKTIILVNAPKKKQTPSKVSVLDLPHNFSSVEKEEKTPSRPTSFEPKPSLGRSRSINSSSKSHHQNANTPNNSRATSINWTFSTGSTTAAAATTTTPTTTRANSFNNERKTTARTTNAPRSVNRSTSMNISRSRCNNSNVVMSSFRSFNKSRSGHIIMFSNSSGVLKPPAMEKELECTLEELCHGCVKKIRVSRDVYSCTGQITQEEEVLTVNVKPGWKAGTKITFQGTTTDDKPGEYRADVVFIVTEKSHRLFRRNGDDLEMEMEIPLVDALTGWTLTIPLLEGEKITMAIDDVVYPGYEKVIEGKGMPNQKNAHQRGDLKVKFLVDFPKSLTQERRSDIFRIFSDVDFKS